MSNARFARSGWVAPTSAIPAGQGTSVVCRQSQFEPFGGEIVAADCVHLVRVVKSILVYLGGAGVRRFSRSA